MTGRAVFPHPATPDIDVGFDPFSADSRRLTSIPVGTPGLSVPLPLGLGQRFIDTTNRAVFSHLVGLAFPHLFSTLSLVLLPSPHGEAEDTRSPWVFHDAHFRHPIEVYPTCFLMPAASFDQREVAAIVVVEPHTPYPLYAIGWTVAVWPSGHLLAKMPCRVLCP